MFKFGFGVAIIGNVGEGRNKTTARHRVSANLDHAVAKTALGNIRRSGLHVGNAFFNFSIGIAIAENSFVYIVRYQFGNRHADPKQCFRIIK